MRAATMGRLLILDGIEKAEVWEGEREREGEREGGREGEGRKEGGREGTQIQVGDATTHVRW